MTFQSLIVNLFLDVMNHQQSSIFDFHCVYFHTKALSLSLFGL
jgi:hypothetical protein